MQNTQIHTFHFSDTKDRKQPRSDKGSILVKENVFAIFDGVTFPHQDSQLTQFIPKQVADLSAKTVVEYILQNKNQTNKLDLLKETIEVCNKKIKEFNTEHGITPDTVDYVQKQYAGVTGAFGFLEDNTFYFAQINDSGVMVFDSEQNREVDFVLNQTPFIRYLNKRREEGTVEKDSVEEHKFVRSRLVNSPNIEFEGKKLWFGVLTGQDEATQFFRVGATSVRNGQVAFFYSDGLIPFVYDKEFVRVVFDAENQKQVEDFIKEKESKEEKYKKEKSLIIVKFT